MATIEPVGGGMLIHITACTECGVRNKTVHWRAIPYRGGMLVSVICAACEERITTEAKQAERSGGDDSQA